MKWKKKQVSELCELIIDCVNKTAPVVDFATQYKMIRTSNVRNGRLNTDDVRFVNEDIFIKWTRRGKPLKGDIILTREAPLGEVAIINNDDDLFLGQRTIMYRTNKSVCDNYFLYYSMCAPFVQGQLKSFGTGSTVEHIKVPDTQKFFVSVPPITIQHKIVSILTAYDDLIENNLKRIKLLEEKAQLSYKELIQELTFSKPRQEYIKDCLAYYIGGGWGEDVYKEGYTEPAFVIRGTDIPDAKSGNFAGIPKRFHKSSNLVSRKMQVGDIVLEISNGQINNIGRTVLISPKLIDQFDAPVICASFAKLIRVNEKVSPEFFHLYLIECQHNGLLYQYKSNSANGINNFAFETFIAEVRISIPQTNDLKLFTEKVRPIFNLIGTLGSQNTKLCAARNILMTKLISSEIEV